MPFTATERLAPTPPDLAPDLTSHPTCDPTSHLTIDPTTDASGGTTITAATVTSSVTSSDATIDVTTDALTDALIDATIDIKPALIGPAHRAHSPATVAGRIQIPRQRSRPLPTVERTVRATAPDICFVVPTRNESACVSTLVSELAAELGHTTLSWEVLFVDDSDDDTPAVIRDLQRRDVHVSLMARRGAERVGGLSGAVLDGFDATEGGVLAVLDGDLQHPPATAVAAAQMVFDGNCDLAVASRYVPGGSSAGLAGPVRRLVSRAAVLVAHVMLPRSRQVKDPMTGCFAAARGVVAGADLHPDGFKVLMEILAVGQWGEVREIPLQFAARGAGASKAGPKEGMRFLSHVRDLASRSRR